MCLHFIEVQAEDLTGKKLKKIIPEIPASQAQRIVKQALYDYCDDSPVTEARTTPFCPSQEKLHTVVFTGCQKYF